MQHRKPRPKKAGFVRLQHGNFEYRAQDPDLEMIRIPKIDTTHLEKQTAANRCCIANY
jgi:hypothetical protein